MADFQLDLREYLCPVPLLMTKNAINGLKHGQSLTIWVNNSVSQTEFEQLAKQLNVQFEAKSAFHFYFIRNNNEE